ncbi:hypothetical protein DPMN_095808 [Dreissena polymorpha]|uniref:Uncharacterized protein n=1 Tax=Dreissena polymorpha TaxID=45954 RepID=A0A9D4LA76_DREPO|nr:hypothetical protein DPMN_095808 [Dreissena polymorpha]
MVPTSISVLWISLSAEVPSENLLPPENTQLAWKLHCKNDCVVNYDTPDKPHVKSDNSFDQND